MDGWMFTVTVTAEVEYLYDWRHGLKRAVCLRFVHEGLPFLLEFLMEFLISNILKYLNFLDLQISED